MPTYRNLNDNVVGWDGASFLPGEIRAVNFFVPYESLNFELVSNDPSVESPVIFSGTVTDATIDIPYFPRVTLSAITGTSAVLYLADDADGIYITNAAGFSMTARWRELGRVRVAGTAQIVAERG